MTVGRLFVLALSILGLVPGMAVPQARATTSVYYDVDFDADPPGQAPGLDTGPFPRAGPSRLHLPAQTSFVDPTVVEGVGSLQERPLAFAATTQVDDPYVPSSSVWFDLDPAAPLYRILFDVEIGSLSPTPFHDSFVVALDGQPGVLRNLSFTGAGDLRLFQGALPLSERNADLGSFALGEALRIAIDVDFAASRIGVAIDGLSVFDGSLSGTTLPSLRFVLQDHDGDGSARAAIDNVRITAPEPRLAMLLALGALAWTIFSVRPR